MEQTRIIKMEERHVDEAACFIARVLDEPKEVTCQDLEDFLDWDDEEVLLLVVETGDGRFAGVAGVIYEEWNDTSTIEWIGLIPELRGQRIGTDLLDRMIEWTRAQGGRKIYVDTGVEEVKALAFYEKKGFSREALLKDWYRDGDDAVLLSLRVTEPRSG
ncbi:Ribosomal protein S18 acetylase RimI [Alkalispirochaeta americana]|uniref:Ribosomal protein S18 acetylase RimI n=1 Tax=Alkalispirochaeta americana TaxID=159291 RepID=A0A1N6SKL7_9SPIO|nr:GNAT family N-acetyltransferase [Alkalispirochaeta americana]SIQ41683.1 Ribosomal protein S18 acetylase RimI [Alkalispirochaeta americana]